MLALILLILVFVELACCIWCLGRLKSYVNIMQVTINSQTDLRARVQKLEGIDIVDAPAKTDVAATEGVLADSQDRPQVEIDDDERAELVAGLSDLPDSATPAEREQAKLLLALLGK